MNTLLLGAGGIALIIVAVILLILLLWGIGVRNSLVKLNLKVNEAESDIDVALTKRFDQLTKLLDTTKGYAKHEAETLENVIKWRNNGLAGSSMAEKAEISAQMDQVASRLNVVVEQYPDLKASENFKTLQLAINDVEEHLQASRRLYNSNVESLNEKILVFPSNIIANMCHIKQREFFKAEERKREDVKMEF